MALVPFRHRGLWEPWDDFIDHFLTEWPEGKQGFVPALDIYEREGKIVVESPLSGIDPEDVDISIEDNILTVQGKTEKKSEVEEKNYYRKEVRSGSFHRSVVLPSKVLGDQAEADYRDGLLKITIPKAEKEEHKTKVKVKTK